MDEAGVPPGVFNLVNGDGPTVGEALSSHPGIDMMSFTGSTRAGIAVAKAAADTVKRVAQELGGKSANIVLDDADLNKAVAQGVQSVMTNSGQSCNAPTRMFVPRAKQDQAIGIAKAAAEKVKVGDPFADGTTIGPVVSEVQFNKIQGLIKKGIDEGATLVTGGLGRPEGLNRGYYVRPTIFANVTNDMTIAREEIFGPVLAVIPFDDDEDALRICNDSDYGLGGAIFTGDADRGLALARRVQSGSVGVNHYALPIDAPFGGVKQSGIGRELGPEGLAAYLETKAIYRTP
jgi:aldehyde dehydrogenase (NAD+)